MGSKSICDFVGEGKATSLYGRERVPCTREATIRVFVGHDANLAPIYRHRCLIHASLHMGPGIVAVWDDDSEVWAPTVIAHEGVFSTTD